jgi:hypothetical protein
LRLTLEIIDQQPQRPTKGCCLAYTACQNFELVVNSLNSTFHIKIWFATQNQKKNPTLFSHSKDSLEVNSHCSFSKQADSLVLSLLPKACWPQ